MKQREKLCVKFQNPGVACSCIIARYPEFIVVVPGTNRKTASGDGFKLFHHREWAGPSVGWLNIA